MSERERERYEHAILKCPKCGEQGELLYRLEHGRRYWVIRHHYVKRSDDCFCHFGTMLPSIIRDIIDGKKPTTLDSF